jgi:hypothetical protein
MFVFKGQLAQFNAKGRLHEDQTALPTTESDFSTLVKIREKL